MNVKVNRITVGIALLTSLVACGSNTAAPAPTAPPVASAPVQGPKDVLPEVGFNGRAVNELSKPGDAVKRYECDRANYGTVELKPALESRSVKYNNARITVRDVPTTEGAKDQAAVIVDFDQSLAIGVSSGAAIVRTSLDSTSDQIVNFDENTSTGAVKFNKNDFAYHGDEMIARIYLCLPGM